MRLKHLFVLHSFIVIERTARSFICFNERSSAMPQV